MLSTDSEAIADAGRTAGAEVPWLRPDELAADTSPEWAAWQHLNDWLTTTITSPNESSSCPAPRRYATSTTSTAVLQPLSTPLSMSC